MELSHIICQARFPLKQVNGKFHTESEENLHNYLKMCLDVFMEKGNGGLAIQAFITDIYIASIGKVTVLHDCIAGIPIPIQV